ncbi:MAG: hypothetical protein D6766_05015, partial [Verrucomicrobia bacterium]
LLSAAFATNQVVAVSNHVAKTTGIHLPLTDPQSPVEVEFQRLLEQDQDALDDADRWIREEEQLAARGAGMGSTALRARIMERFKPVEQAYEDFIRRHPDHVRARLAYGSFLNDTGREREAVAQWEKARELAPNNPAAWNNLANYYGHRGPVMKAFPYYEKAIQLNPAEVVYRRNLAATVSLFRRDAQEYYKLPDDQAVLRKALELYRQARQLAPRDFTLATETAQLYYMLKPVPPDDPEAARRLLAEAMDAWKAALELAPHDLARQGVYIHMVRTCLNAGDLDQARQYLAKVNHPALEQLRQLQERRLQRLEHPDQADPSDSSDPSDPPDPPAPAGHP